MTLIPPTDPSSSGGEPTKTEPPSVSPGSGPAEALNILLDSGLPIDASLA